MERISFLIGVVLAIVGMYYIDRNIIFSFELNHSKWFGKYVFFAAFNILILWALWFFYKKLRGVWRILAPLLFGIIILAIGVKLA